jgi:hypothetical protein
MVRYDCDVGAILVIALYPGEYKIRPYEVFHEQSCFNSRSEQDLKLSWAMT